MSIFSQRLKDLRLEKGINQTDVAKHIGVSVQSYSAYEAAREPKYDALCKLANFFNVTTDYLLGRTDVKRAENQALVSELGLTEDNINFIKNGLSSLAGAATQYPPGDKRTFTDILNMMLNDNMKFIQLLAFIRLATTRLPHKGVAVAWGDEKPTLLLTEAEAAQKGYAKVAHDLLDKIIENIANQSRRDG